MAQGGGEAGRSWDLTEPVIGACIEVHRHPGPGLLESAYEESLCHELRLAGLGLARQRPLAVRYKGIELDCGYRLDVVIQEQLILELKAVDRLLPVHEAQLPQAHGSRCGSGAGPALARAPLAWRASRRASVGTQRSPFGQFAVGLMCWPPILAAGWLGRGVDTLATFDRVDVCTPVFDCWAECGEDDGCAEACLDGAPVEDRGILDRLVECSNRRCGDVSDARLPGCEQDHCSDELARCDKLVPKRPRPPVRQKFRPRHDWP